MASTSMSPRSSQVPPPPPASPGSPPRLGLLVVLLPLVAPRPVSPCSSRPRLLIGYPALPMILLSVLSADALRRLHRQPGAGLAGHHRHQMSRAGALYRPTNKEAPRSSWPPRVLRGWGRGGGVGWGWRMRTGPPDVAPGATEMALMSRQMASGSWWRLPDLGKWLPGVRGSSWMFEVASGSLQVAPGPLEVGLGPGAAAPES